ncbi:aminopeptidase [Gemmobacter aquarius]|uniref:Aminopeptidase n=1 Tax=Paragemmobacter aquarius TaxID=2169400 RepID=A0A2S0UM89_9RHOB|nr:P1 family peptidase [Gemmobacter aquarius]AWB48913.1 aminopeptidase [Gemmobacter aquarius]
MTKAKPRARDLGLPFRGTPGPLNAITDVAGVSVGFTTLTDPEIHLRTGVTAVRTRQDADHPRPVMAGHFSFNGNGEMTGTHWIDDAGYFGGPILITNTHAIGACHTGATRWMIDHYASHFAGHAWAMPVVAETYDGRLNDINAMRVTPYHAIAAIATAAAGPVAEGNIGGGNGMVAYGFKAGTGTASRRISIGQEYTLGALVQANHGLRDWLTILGKPLASLMPDVSPLPRETGSIIVILATDAPLSALSLKALAKRAALGIGRTGTAGGNSSGDIFLAFSTADIGPMPDSAGYLNQAATLNPHHIDPLYLAAVEATDEAIVNALVAADPVPTFKPPGGMLPAIDTAALAALFRQGDP